MAKFGCLPRFIGMLRQFHDGRHARFQNEGEYSEPFPVTNWVNHCCVMEPTLVILTDAFQDRDAGLTVLMVVMMWSLLAVLVSEFR